MGSETNGRSINSRLAKAETLLAIALITELVLETWVYPRVEIPRAGKTLIKMTIIVGLYGPVMAILGRMIDSGLDVTRKAAANSFSVPLLGFHLVVLALLFTVFHYTMYKEMPWASQRHAALEVRSRP